MSETVAQVCARAVAMWEAGGFAEAETLLRQVIAQLPDSPQPHYELARLLHVAGRWPEARPEYEATLRAMPGHPAIELDLGHLLLGLGDYARGWPLYERRKEVPGQRAEALQLPEWLGGDLAGKRLLVWWEQGFGDMIMAARFVPELVGRGAQVTLVAPAPLVRLFAGLGAEVVALEPSMQLAAPDLYTLPLSIPHRLGVRPETLPGAPYLAAAPSRPGGGVGVFWRGRDSHANDAQRSLPAELAERLLALPGAVSLQPEDTGAADFQDTAGIVAGLDRVITVDSAVAHLAGAMGKPVSVLLPNLRTDWRWMRDRRDSPWYPSAELFRQGPDNAWAAVVDEVVARHRAA
jgi:hypothetical protein